MDEYSHLSSAEDVVGRSAGYGTIATTTAVVVVLEGCRVWHVLVYSCVGWNLLRIDGTRCHMVTHTNWALSSSHLPQPSRTGSGVCGGMLNSIGWAELCCGAPVCLSAIIVTD